MKRREFLAASAATLALSAMDLSRADDKPAETSSRQLIELRIYNFTSPEKMKAYEDFLAGAGVAAFNRAGVSPVGIFKLMKGDNAELKLTEDGMDLYVLLTHKSTDSVLSLTSTLNADEELQKACAALAETQKDPAYKRYESSLLLAFPKAPAVLTPAKGPDRVFQLRIYESHNAERAKMKMHMFNDGGELDVFQKCGMTWVFFGQSLVGSKMPNLHYMLGFDDMKAQKAAWDGFKKHPGWLKLKDDPMYKDTVSHITNLFLRPAASSQI